MKEKGFVSRIPELLSYLLEGYLQNMFSFKLKKAVTDLKLHYCPHLVALS